MKQDQVHESPQQEPSKQQASFSLKEWVLKKLFQYIDGTFQALFTAAILGGALLIVQYLWGLRLLPFNVLDTILLVVVTAIVLLGLITLLFWLGFKWLLMKHPEFFVLLGLMALVLYLINKYPKLFSVTAAELWKKEQTTSAAPSGASGQGNDQP